MDRILKVGMVGLDTSHCEAFTRLLNDPADPHHIPGAKVVAGFPGATADWPVSNDRVAGFTATLRDKYNVEILDCPEAVADAVDMLMITSVDGRRHREFLQRTIAAGKPTFVDKPFALCEDDAQAMLDLAREHSIPLMSSSALRYADPFAAALNDDSQGAIVGIDAYGPMALQPQAPGVFWYGCHSFEMIVAAMGVGCSHIEAQVDDKVDLHVMTWSDGRRATFRGLRTGANPFGATLHRENGFQQIDIRTCQRPFYVSLLEAVVRSLPHGHSDVPAEQMLEVVRVMQHANVARDTGEPVALAAPAPAGV